MEAFLRTWRQDAMNKHQYESAIFIGDKLLALTEDDQDAFYLAQVLFATGNHTRAHGFLQRHNLIDRTASCKYLASLCLIKQGKYDKALETIGDRNPTSLIQKPNHSRRKLQHADGNVRIGPVRQQKGVVQRLDKEKEKQAIRESDELENLKFESAMCHIRGLCFAKQNAFDRAKECYKVAVQIDVQNFEAFDQLMKNSLMAPAEEWEFLESLDFDSIQVPGGDPSASQEAAQFTKMLYTTRLSKYMNAQVFTTASEDLSTHYKLATNPDLRLSKAELFFTQCRFKEALALTDSILAEDKYNFAIYPLHLACLHELGQKTTLFLIAHDLADHHPDEPCAWHAVGIYYLTTSKIAEARRFFSKASLMDPHFGPAWIGFAHTFAAEGEHDQAISAYSTAARLFQGTHLPPLFLGMQNLQLNQMTLASEYLNSALSLCKNDPLLLNELGVVYYHQEQHEQAVAIFQEALNLSQYAEAEPSAWLATRANLGHAYRRAHLFDDALHAFDEVLRTGGKDPGLFTAKGLVLLEMNRPAEAVVALHEALSISPQDPVASDLLGKALEENAAAGLGIADLTLGEEREFEREMMGRKREAMRARERAAARAGMMGGRGRKGRHISLGQEDDDGGMMEISGPDD
ncbi:MAG: anaphase promoting complex subunit cdc16 [Vezdaea aestivalis]|nr:MAG: anaphase promoting complex subunit cdc16 [Vezdaea aestivalis]